MKVAGINKYRELKTNRVIIVGKLKNWNILFSANHKLNPNIITENAREISTAFSMVFERIRIENKNKGEMPIKGL
jgi:hypothetical protein